MTRLPLLLPVDLDNIQGNVTPGFATRRQAFVLLRFGGPTQARHWLAEVSRGVAPARLAGAKEGSLVNVALSWAGLERLGAPGLEHFPEEFREGMAARAGLLGDREVERWEAGGTPDTEAHALVIVGAREPRPFEAAVDRQRRLARAHGLAEVAVYLGAALDGALRKSEHFGYRDSASQPVLGGPGADARVGEFVLGYPDEEGRTALTGPPWAQHGSFLVFRRLRQHVAAFRATLAREAGAAGLTAEQLGAKLIGRWPSGATLGEPLPPRDPGIRDDIPPPITRADFASDPDGTRTPLFAHIRKAHPRALDAATPGRHRLLRRGIPYGPPLPAGAATDDGQDRGLLFVAYQASIARQFELIQQQWFNQPDFPPGVRPEPGADPLVGQPSGRHEVRLPTEHGHVAIGLDRFVTVTAGGYFFTPSIRALALLARPTSLGGERPMSYKAQGGKLPANAAQLGEFIHQQNPYPWQMELPNLDSPSNYEDVEKEGPGKHRDQTNPFTVVDVTGDRERFMEGLFWHFGGKPRRMSKAIRIEYTYKGDDDKEYKQHLLIGYEGAGGGM
jgi:Dyp-type peroxidase family